MRHDHYRFHSPSSKVSGRDNVTNEYWNVTLASLNVGSHLEADLLLEMFDKKAMTLDDNDPKLVILREWMNGLRKTKDMARNSDWGW